MTPRQRYQQARACFNDAHEKVEKLEARLCASTDPVKTRALQARYEAALIEEERALAALRVAKAEQAPDYASTTECGEFFTHGECGARCTYPDSCRGSVRA